jgi:hypothetical protein
MEVAMKKVLGLYLCFVLSVVCMGCTTENRREPENQLQKKYKDSDLFKTIKADKRNTIKVKDEIVDLLSEKQKSFFIKNKKYMRNKNNGEMDANYPFFVGQGKNIKALNKLIEETLNDEEILGFDSGEELVDSELDYEIKTETDNFISILFTGWVNTRTANHPNNLSFTINYDMKNIKQIVLCDIISIDDILLEKVRGAIEDQLGTYMLDGYGKLSVSNFYEQLEDKSQGFYFKDGNIYIRVTISAGAQYMDYVGFEF